MIRADLKLSKAEVEEMIITRDDGSEFVIIQFCENYIVCQDTTSEFLHILNRKEENYRDEILEILKNIDVDKKYWLWKFKDNEKSKLKITEMYLNENYRSTNGESFESQMKSCFYAEKIAVTMHEE